MSNFSHPMVRRSERNPRAEAAGGNGPSIGRIEPPTDMESNTVSSDTITESLDTDSSDELTEQSAAASPPPVNESPGVRMGESADAVPVPEVESEGPTDAEVNSSLQKKSPLGCKSFSRAFPIFDKKLSICSGDIHDQSPKLTKIALNFGRFFALSNLWAFQNLNPFYRPCLAPL